MSGDPVWDSPGFQIPLAFSLSPVINEVQWSLPAVSDDAYIILLRLIQNGRYFADGIFNYIWLKWSYCILIPISLKIVLNGATVNNLVMVHVIIQAF